MARTGLLQNAAFHWGSGLQANASSLGPCKSIPKMASWSIQLFLQGSPCQTHRRTKTTLQATCLAKGCMYIPNAGNTARKLSDVLIILPVFATVMFDVNVVIFLIRRRTAISIPASRTQQKSHTGKIRSQCHLTNKTCCKLAYDLDTL